MSVSPGVRGQAETVTTELVRELAVLQPGVPVLSVHLRTDPRDPANKARTPAWLVALRNGLRDAAGVAEELHSREERLALGALFERVEADVRGRPAAERGRGLTWFVTADGRVDHWLTMHLPPREQIVRLDARPFISPLVDIADRGRPAGLVLIGAEAMRLLHWEGGRVEELERSLYQFDRGEWRDYAAYAMANPGGPAMHVDTVERRLEEWRRRFLREAASTLAARLPDLGWQRVLVAGDARAAGGLARALPASARERIVAEVDANLLWEEPAAVAERLEEPLEAAWAQEARALAQTAVEAARTGGPGAVGWSEVLDTLTHHRVRHLVLSRGAAPSLASLPSVALQALGSPSRELVVERAVEHAVAAGAEVTSLREEESHALGGADAAAILRY